MNTYGQKAKDYLAEYCPMWYSEIEDKEAYFTEIGETAENQVSSIYSKLSRPELGGNDLATRQMAEETIRELLYPHRRGTVARPIGPEGAERTSTTRRIRGGLDAGVGSDATGDAARRGLVAFRPTGQLTSPHLARGQSRGQPGCTSHLAAAPVGIERAEPRRAATLARWASWGAVPEVFDDTTPDSRRLGQSWPCSSPIGSSTRRGAPPSTRTTPRQKWSKQCGP